MENAGNKNLVLCGFMGCGKTTLGPLLAERLGRSFVDADIHIEQKAGMRIPEIFERFTEQGFRDREHEALVELSQREGLVISTGGGVFDYPRNIPPLRLNGVILYLNPSFEECYRRIADSDRPLVRRSTLAELEALYRRREANYRSAAHLELRAEGPPEDWVEAAVKLLEGVLI